MSLKTDLPTTIDIKKYRTKELITKVTELLDLRGTFGSGLWQALLAASALNLIIAFFATGMAAHWHSVDWRLILLLLMIVIVGFPLALPGGIFYAIACLIRRALDKMLEIIDLMLETTKTISADVAAVRTGEAELPSSRKLVEIVYLKLFLPILEQAISKQLWIFGMPLLLLYRITMGRLVRVIIRILPDSALLATRQDGEELADHVSKELTEVAENQLTITDTLSWTQRQINHLGYRAKLMIMLPCYAICGTLIAMSVGCQLANWMGADWLVYEAFFSRDATGE